jgi:hypothetical protein
MRTFFLAITVAFALFGCGVFLFRDRPGQEWSPEKPTIVCELPIPPRLQWRPRNGYCGECSIQQSALFYGSYVSQFVCRQIVDATQEQDVLVRINADLVLRSLRLKFDEFDTSNQPVPQYKPYLEWTKRHLQMGHPVLIVLFDQNDNSRDYDHIALATGFHSRDATKYHPEDTLIFNDNFTLEPRIRRFSTLHDTREMNGNGSEYFFCIPENYAFGCAVTGIDDETGLAQPIQIGVNREDEPDVVDDEVSVELVLSITIRDLKPGRKYVVYRYDDYNQIPTRNYADSNYHSAREFIADADIKTIADQCQSNGLATYRCVPAETDGPANFSIR